ncbi:hypothetical protein GWI33_002182, partial [Rhynchophorus ferrugineus]
GESVMKREPAVSPNQTDWSRNKEEEKALARKTERPGSVSGSPGGGPTVGNGAIRTRSPSLTRITT